MSQVSPEDFAQIKDAVHEFIRTRVVPREREIADNDLLTPAQIVDTVLHGVERDAARGDA